MLPDLRFALRSLLKTPGFTTVALLTLALGIGANTAIFSVVQSVLLRPFSYPDPDHLVILWEDGANIKGASIAWPDLQDWQKQNTTFDAIGGYRRDNFTLTGRGEPEMVRGARVSAALFDAIKLPALNGRVFRADEDKPGAPPLAVLYHAFWQSRLGGDPGVIGQTLTLSGESYTVIGVMPPEFITPTRADFLTQLARISTNPGWQDRDHHPGIYAIGRMKPGLTFEQALAGLKQVSAQIAKAYPDSSTGMTATGQLLFEIAVGDYRQGLIILLGVVALVLLIACANLTNLLLARSSARAQEFAVRVALGASRGRIVRHLLVESLVLAVAGGGLGVLFAAWARSGIVALSPAGVTRFENAAIDGRVLAATCVLALATALIFGLWPAWKSSQPDLHAAMQSGGRTGSDGPRAARARETLIIAEIALTLVLLVGAGLLLRSFMRAQAADLGFQPEGVLTAQITLPEKSYATDEPRAAFADRLREQLAALPGVLHAECATQSPLNTGWQTSFLPEGRAPWPAGQDPFAEMNAVTDGYFRALGIPLLRGRAFGPQDTPKTGRVAIIDQGFAQRYWPGVDPVGQKMILAGADTTVIGVVPTLKVYGYATEPELVQAYLSFRQMPQGDYLVLLRTAGDPAALTATLRRAVAEIDPNQPVWDVRTLAERIDGTFATPRLYTFLLAIFAGLALLLAAVGLYGVLAFQVGRRTREFGIRIALGARHAQLLTLVLRRGLRLLALGVAVGLAGSLALSRVLGSLLYRTSAFDPVVFGGVTAVLASVALLASYLPARRATQVDPMTALRAE